MPLNQKLTDKPLKDSFSDKALVHIVEPEDYTQGSEGSDYKMLAKDFQAQAGQDNIDIRKHIKIDLDDTVDDILVKINNMSTYTVSEKQSVWFVSSLSSVIIPNSRILKFKMMNKGKGTYGVGGTQLSILDIELMYDNTATILDIENDPTTDKLEYGDLTGQTISEWLNSQDPAKVIQSQEDGYTIFKGSVDGVETTYLWIGEPGVYGAGETMSTMADFEILSDKIEPEEDEFVKTYPIQNASVDNVRNDQPSFVELDNGNILCAFNHFGEEGSDIDTAYIAGKISSDGGGTWGSVFTLQDVILGTDNVLVPSLHKREDGKILMLFFAQTAPVPTPESRIYKKLFNQDMTVFSGPTDLSMPTGYYGGVGCDRIFLDETNGNLLYPVGRLISGDGTSYGSVYEATILVSEDDGDTWTDLDLHIGSDKLLLGAGGGIEPGIFYTPTGLVCYFRTLTGYVWAVKLDASYSPDGEEYVLFPSSNAMSSIKWVDSLNMAVAGRTRLLENNPIGDNVRKYLDLLTSPDGKVFSTIDEIDHAIEDEDWYVNQPVVFESGNKIIVGYNNSKTGIKTASLFAKIYPKSFFGYSYKPEAYIGLSDDGKGKLINGVQVINSTDDTRNSVAVKYPKGGYLSLTGTSDTGAIQITLPNNNEAYLTIKGSIYSNSDNSSIDFTIICNSADMSKNTVKMNSFEITTPLNVRFSNGTNPKIFIGELASGWNKLSVLISEVIGFNNTRLSDIYEGWNISLQTTSFGTVVSTKNNTLNANVRGGSFTVSNAPSGLTMYLLRAGFGTLFANSSTEDGYLCYNGAGSTLYYRVFGNGNFTIGQAAGVDTGERLQVNGNVKIDTGNITILNGVLDAELGITTTGNVEGATASFEDVTITNAPTVGTSGTNKDYVDERGMVNLTNVPFTLATINALYPNAQDGDRIVCPKINTGTIYTKADVDWIVTAGVLLT